MQYSLLVFDVLLNFFMNFLSPARKLPIMLGANQSLLGIDVDLTYFKCSQKHMYQVTLSKTFNNGGCYHLFKKNHMKIPTNRNEIVATMSQRHCWEFFAIFWGILKPFLVCWFSLCHQHLFKQGCKSCCRMISNTKVYTVLLQRLWAKAESYSVLLEYKVLVLINFFWIFGSAVSGSRWTNRWV